MFYLYILRSKTKGRYYIGHSADYKKRLVEHNRGKVRSTKAYIPWEVVYTEEYETKSEAFNREMKIKSYKSGEAFYKLFN